MQEAPSHPETGAHLEGNRLSPSLSLSLFLLALAGCAPAERAKAAGSVGSQQQPLKADLSSFPAGRGFDPISRDTYDHCVARGPADLQPYSTWDATGFVVSQNATAEYYAETSYKIGLKTKTEGGASLGATISDRVRNSAENVVYTMMIRGTTHKELAGPLITGAPPPTCSLLNHLTFPSQLGNFVQGCGMEFIQEKIWGGYVMLGWERRNVGTSIERKFKTEFEVETKAGISFGATTRLEAIEAAGYGDEELRVSFGGLPAPPLGTLSDGGTAGAPTVLSILNYIRGIQDAGIRGSWVVDFSTARYQMTQVNACLSAGGYSSPVADFEWKCMYDHLQALAAARDEWASTEEDQNLQAEFRRLRNADQYIDAGRVQFSVVKQARCALPDGGMIDDDGDPSNEESGRCHDRLLRAALAQYESCRGMGADAGYHCRNTTLGTATTCADFVDAGCRIEPGCTRADLQQVVRTVPQFFIKDPIPAATPVIAGWRNPRNIEFNVDNIAPLPIPNSADEVCALTRITGSLLYSKVMIWAPASTGANWSYSIKSRSTAPSDQVRGTITCTKLTNFTYINGGITETHNYYSLRSRADANYWLPWGVGPGFTKTPFAIPFVQAFNGNQGYLYEPETAIRVRNKPSTPGPFTSHEIQVRDTNGVDEFEGFFAYLLIDAPTPIWQRLTMDQESGSREVNNGPVGARTTDNRSLGLNASPGFSGRKPDSAFCFFTELSGRFYNDGDFAEIDYGLGEVTARTSTIEYQDRVPTIRAQCVRYDQ